MNSSRDEITFDPSTSHLRPDSHSSDSSSTDPTLAASRSSTKTAREDHPERVGNYRVLQLLGEGGMGSVYLAEQREPVRRKVALKLIKPGMDTKDVLARFDSERQALALMSHPNVAAVYDAGMNERGLPFFVMEYVSGVPITRFCDEARLTTRQRLELLIQVCEAVQHAHQKGIIHRDLKPSNILVMHQDDRPIPKVIDFGVAKATTQRLSEMTLHTQLGQIVGTPEYMSPEQASSSGLDVDTRTDVYSLGVVLYVLLTGELPIDSKALRKSGAAEMQRIIRESQPRLPSTRISDPASSARLTQARSEDVNAIYRHLRGDLDWVVMKAIDKDRSRRYASASELSADIRRWLNGEPVAAGPPSSVYRLRKFVGRHRGAVAAGAALGLTLVVGLAVSLWQYFNAERARLEELEQRRVAEVRRVAAENARADAERELDRALRAETAAAKSAEEARAAAARSDAVNEFMRSVLTAPDIRKGGHDITVAEALDRAAAELSTKFEHYPEARLAGHVELANTYFSIGRYERAIEQCESARTLINEQFKGEHEEEVRILVKLGAAYDSIDKPDKAEPLLHRAVEIALQRYGPRHWETYSARNQLAQFLQGKGKLAQAESEFRTLLDFARELGGADDRRTLVAMNCLAWNLLSQDRFEEAEHIYRDCIERAERTLGPDDADTLIPLANLGPALTGRGDLVEAERVLRDALARISRVFGPEHPDTVLLMKNLADALGKAHKLDQAVPLRRQIVELTARTLPENRGLVSVWFDYLQTRVRAGDTADAEPEADKALELAHRLLDENDMVIPLLGSVAAQIYSNNGKPQRGIEIFEKYIPIARKIYGDDGRETLVMLSCSALTLGELDRHEEAEAFYKEIIETGAHTLGPENRDVMIWRYNLAHSAVHRGQFEKALAEFETLSRNVGRSISAGDPLAALIMGSMGAMHAEQERFDEALSNYRAAYTIRVQSLGPNHRDTLMFRGRMASMLLQKGDVEDALRTARKVLVARREVLPDGDPEIVESLLILGECLTRSGELVEAESSLRESLALRRAKQQTADEHVARCRSALGECLTLLGRYVEAETELLAAHEVIARDSRNRILLRQCTGRLVRLFDTWGKHERADEWRARPHLLPPPMTTQPAAPVRVGDE